MEELINKAKILMEALPYIRRFYEKTLVIKYGGSAMVDAELKAGFAMDMTLLKYIGINPVVVHGGGPQIGEVLERMGKKSEFVEGMRVTDEETVDIVEMVLVGKVNKEIVSLINRNGGKAVGLSGKDGNLMLCKKLSVRGAERGGLLRTPEIIDVGRVGEVERVNPAIIEALERDNFIPVIAPVADDAQGETYNINADLVAGQIAASLRAEKLIILTDVDGVTDSDSKLISTLDTEEAKRLIEEGVVSGGMVPKIRCAVEALGAGVRKAHIVDGRVLHAVLLEIFTDVGVGTQITHPGTTGGAKP